MFNSNGCWPTRSRVAVLWGVTFAVALTVAALPLVSFAQPQSSEQQKLVLSYFRDVLDGAKVDVLESLFLPDCAIHRPEGDIAGIAGLRAMVAGRRANFSKFTTEVHDIFESGDRVVVRLTHHGTGVGTYRFRIGMHDVRDRTLTWDAIVIFRMKNGKIAEEWVSRDELGMLLTAGVLKADVGRR